MTIAKDILIVFTDLGHSLGVGQGFQRLVVDVLEGIVQALDGYFGYGLAQTRGDHHQ